MNLRRWLLIAATTVGHGTPAAVLAAAVGLAAVGDAPALRFAAPQLARGVVPAALTPPAPPASNRPQHVGELPQVPADAEEKSTFAPQPIAPAKGIVIDSVAPQAAPATPPAPAAAASPPPNAALAPAAPVPSVPPAAAPSAAPPPPAPAVKTAVGTPVAAEPPAGKDGAQTAVVPPIQRVAPGKAARGAAVIAAKELFGKAATPAPLAARAIGSYARGCLAGAEPLAVDGPAWQAMRLSRNRNWGHPDLIRLIERFAGEAKAGDQWPGLLVGDLSQPRGGPMLTGHASHQIGLDADIWLTPMPERRLSTKEREDLAATSMLGPDQLSVEPNVWTAAHVRIIKRVASYPEVERVLVHPAIKQALCASVGRGPEDAWLAKVRPIWGHHYHMHVRISCPKDSPGCTHQAVPPSNLAQACTREVADWLALIKRSLAPAPPPRPGTPPAPKAPPTPPVTVDHLPAECRIVLESDTARGSQTAGAQKK